MALSATDIVQTVRALYPRRRPASLSSEVDTIHSGVRSSASSVSGFSLFQNSSSLPPPSWLHPGWQPEGDAAPFPYDKVADEYLSADNGNPCGSAVWFDPERMLATCHELEQHLDIGGLSDEWITLVGSPGQSLKYLPSQASVQDDRTRTQALQPVTALIETLAADFENGDGEFSQSVEVTATYNRLRQTLQRQMRVAEELTDFVAAHHWHHESLFIQNLESREADEGVLADALEGLKNSALSATEEYRKAIEANDRWLRLTRPSLDANATKLAKVAQSFEQVRDKMWFVADVRSSALYDEARCVAGALRVMGKPKRAPRTRAAPPLRHWSASKLNTSLHLKTEAQILYLMSALPQQGGPNKLSDDQARSTLSWMEQNNVESLCRGEERLHRLCMEIRKCVQQATMPDSALLMSNPLFARGSSTQARSQTSGNHTSQRSPLSALKATTGRLDRLSLQTNIAPSADAASATSYALSSASSRDFVESRSPTLTHQSSIPFWSPAVTEEQVPSSATSVGSYQTRTAHARRPNTSGSVEQALDPSGDRLKCSLTSLLLSDLTSTLFVEGSETDRAFWTGLGGDLLRKHLRNLDGPLFMEGQSPHVDRVGVESRPFDYDLAMGRALRCFSSVTDPLSKLHRLHEVNQLLSLQSAKKRSHINNNSIPKACKDDELVAGFRRLFSNAELRPTAILRDLQHIAALAPAHLLESSPQGKAFWNAAVAITQIKQAARTLMVETADSIIAYHSNNRGHGRSPSSAQQQRDSATFTTSSRSSSAEDAAQYSMADAGYLLQITAKEGDPVAQRELATLYLTNPDLMDHIIAPFSRPKDVFKEELESKWRKNQDPSRCDPATMCVAHHWMSLSSKGGDALAKEFLRQREEMERLP